MIDKKVIVTGGNGFIGRLLIKKLKTFGIEAINLSRKNTDSYDNQLKYFNSDYIDTILRDNENIKIAFLLGWGKMDSPSSNYHLNENVINHKSLIKKLYKKGVEKIIFLGSATEYGETVGNLNEDCNVVGKLSNYAKGKNEVSQIGRDLAEKYSGIFIHIRLFYVYGPFQRKNSLINYLIDCKENNIFPEVGDGQYFRDYIFLNDAVDGIIKISKINKSIIINLGSGEAVKVKDYISQLWKHLGGYPEEIKFGIKPMSSSEPKQQYAFADNTLIEELINWCPKVTVSEGLRLTIQSIKKK